MRIFESCYLYLTVEIVRKSLCKKSSTSSQAPVVNPLIVFSDEIDSMYCGEIVTERTLVPMEGELPRMVPH